MIDSTRKKNFLGEELIHHIESISPDTSPLWGKMNLHQMVEHLSDAVKFATNYSGSLIITPMESLAKMNAFARSDKPFREETKSPFLPENPLPLRKKSLAEAIEFLKISLGKFHNRFQTEEGLMVLNPVFGELDYSGQVSLLYKHAVHHLNQFGVKVQSEMA